MKNKIVYILLLIAFRLLIDIIYQTQIANLFGYVGYLDESTNASLMTSWIVFAIFIPFILWVIDENKIGFSQIVMYLIVFFRIVPFTSLVRFIPQDYTYIISNLVYWILVSLLLNRMKPQNIMGLLSKSVARKQFINIICFVFVVTVVLVSGVYCHFRIHLDLSDVYELRMEARDFNMPIILKYLQAASSNIIPILIIYYITQNKRTIVYLLIFIGLLNFSIAGHKATLFKILLCMGLFYFPRFDIKKYTPLFLVLISVVSVFEFLVYNSSILSTLIIRRMFYTPPCLDIAYYDYIVQNGPTYFMDSIAFKLGALRGDESTRCNNGMFSDAFMNLGYVGCLVFPLLFAYLSKIFDYITTGLERSLTFFAAFIFMLTLESSYLTTSMLTHGIFLLGVTLYFFPKEDSSMISMQANNL